MKKLIALLIAVATVLTITYWQIQAGVARCGTVDGGVLALPLVLIAAYLIKGVAKDLKEVFADEKKRASSL